jgi:hypothetical protein
MQPPYRREGRLLLAGAATKLVRSIKLAGANDPPDKILVSASERRQLKLHRFKGFKATALIGLHPHGRINPRLPLWSFWTWEYKPNGGITRRGGVNQLMRYVQMILKGEKKEARQRSAKYDALAGTMYDYSGMCFCVLISNLLRVALA